MKRYLKKKLDKGNSFIYNLCETKMLIAMRSHNQSYKLSLIALKAAEILQK